MIEKFRGVNGCGFRKGMLVSAEILGNGRVARSDVGEVVLIRIQDQEEALAAGVAFDRHGCRFSELKILNNNLISGDIGMICNVV
ncbi:hypothetical protein GA0004734_00008680 [Rhizobium sp. 9140]|nr:hypothetical protein GA0004734_00008680 [Rhizobium sp. 9140]